MKAHEANENPPSGYPPEATVRMDPLTEGVSELVQILDHYLAERQAGRTPDRAALLAAHPDLAPQLEQALDGLDFIHQAGSATEELPVQLGDFRIVREVGRGGMGVVYEAEQISLKRRVALKVLRFGAVADEMAMQRFQREAETVARLHHTNIVPIFAIGAEAGVRYYAMQFIEGRHLGELTADARTSHQSVPFADVANWSLQAAEALAHAHQRGVIHRDIKPSNLILDRDGRIWLTDFGLARRVDDVALSVAGALLGTPRYMSPEQARASKDPVDHRTDIYSLGATLYELATRRPIFDATTPHEVLTQILHTDPRAPRLLAPEVPRDLETIILKCLAKDARQRYASAQALADDLRAFLEGRAISARPPSVPERLARWTRKHHRTVTAAGVSAGVSLLLVVGGYLGWRQHQQTRQGRLMLSTSSPNVVAEVLDARDRAVLPAFPVPPPEPVTLPEGSYQVRLAASGVLSETWPLEIVRGQLHQPNVQLNARWLWPPRELSTAELPETEIVSLAGPADLILLTQATMERDGPRYEQRLQRMDGATGFPVWTNALVLTQSNVPPGLTWQEWQRMLWPPGVSSEPRVSRFVQSAPDLDGDGTGDLVWLSRQYPALGAVSGADGRVLWWYRSRPELPAGTTQAVTKVEQANFGALVGQPAVTDADGDGVMDFFACYTTQGERYQFKDGPSVNIRHQSWVALVSGRTGKELWHRRVNERWELYASSSTEQRKFDALCRPAVARAAGRKVFLLCVGSALHGWDALTGQPVWPAQELGFEPRFAPEAAEADGDGDDDVLLVQGPDSRKNADYSQRANLELVAWSPRQRAVRWRRAYLAAYPNFTYELDAAIEPFHRLADLDGDGRPEVLLPIGKGSDWRSRPRWAGMEVLDLKTGQPQWMARLIVDEQHTASRTVDAFIAGPDLDGDGVREVFATWRGYAPELAKGALFVAALSGANGRILWQWSEPVPGPALALDWWHAGPDGWPMLIVPTSGGPGGQRMTYFLSLSAGRVQHTLPDVKAVTSADFDGDGIEDLFYTVHPQGTARHLVVRGEPPAAWQRLGQWRASRDFDGDGFTDLVSVSDQHLVARSGRDGAELWRTGAEQRERDLFLAPTDPTGDLNHDGTPDFVGHVRLWETEGPQSRALVSKLAAFSGRDGKRLWTAHGLKWKGHTTSSSGPVWSCSYPLLDAADLDGDGRSEIFLAQSQGDGPIELSALAGADGRVLWQLPMVKGSWAPQPVTGPRPLADVNGDGVLDVILWRPEVGHGDERQPCGLVAYDGRLGNVIWTAQPAGIQKDSQLIWPEPVVGDLDGDGVSEVIVAVHQNFEAKTGYASHLIALDGRSGDVRWTWRWQAGFPEIWPPLLIADTDGRQLVCVGVREQGKPRLVVLDHAGKVQHELPMAGSQQQRFSTGLSPWRAADLDGDGRTELLFANHGRLMAARGAQLEAVWQWTLPAGDAAVSVVQPASPGQSTELAVWSGKSAYGISGGTGQLVWRSDLPVSPRWGMSDPPELQVLRNPQPGGLPRVQLWWPGHSDYRWATVNRQAWPVAPDGTYRPPTPEKVSLSPLPAVPAPRRPLPWAVNRHAIAWFGSGLLALLAVAVPGWLAYRAIRKQSALLGLVLTAYTGASVWVFDQAIVPLIGVAFAGWMLWQAARERAWPRVALAVIFGAFCLTPMLLLASDHYLHQSHRWGAWWWVDEWLGERILLALATLPGLAFWGHLALAVRRHQWGHVRGLLAASGVVALAVAGIWLWLHQARLEGAETYSLRGWYSVWFTGTYLTGLASLAVLARAAWVRWRIQRKATMAAPEASPA